jgi:hypothetical protein
MSANRKTKVRAVMRSPWGRLNWGAVLRRGLSRTLGRYERDYKWGHATKHFVAALMIAMLLFATERCALANSLVYSIEDKDLAVVNIYDANLIKSDSSFLSFCKLNCVLVGKYIPASVKNNSAVSFITTADGCGWGRRLARFGF